MFRQLSEPVPALNNIPGMSEVLEVQRCWAGRVTKNWVVVTRTGVYRIIIHSDPGRELNQVNGVRRLNQRGYRVLECVHHDASRHLIVFNWIPGGPLFRFDEDNPRVSLKDQQFEGLLDRLVELHSDVSPDFVGLEPEPTLYKDIAGLSQTIKASTFPAFVLDSFTEVWNRSLESLGTAKLLSRQDIKRLIEVRRYGSGWLRERSDLLVPPTFSFLHGDLHPENIIKNGNMVALIDYELWGYGDRAAELAFMLEQFRQSNVFTPAEERAFIQRYLRKLGAAGVVDPMLEARVDFFSRYVLWKFLVLVASGLTAQQPGTINTSLFRHLLDRSEQLLY